MITYDLEEGQELRFQVDKTPIQLELRRGSAEIFGTEMLINKSYTIPSGQKMAAFTYQGATIEVTGEPKSIYVGRETPNSFYLNVHGLLDQERHQIESEQKWKQQIQQNDPSTHDQILESTQEKPDTPSPICLVCGRSNVGKSTLCRILLNYATRRGRTPIFVDLDPGQGQIGLPGTIGALSVESPIDIEEGFSLSSSMLLPFGHLAPAVDEAKKNTLLYETLMDNMAKIVHKKLEQDRKSKQSGAVINTCGLSYDESGYKALIKACKSFKPTIILVIDDDQLQNDLQKDLLDETKVILTPKSGGVTISAPAAKIEERYERIREYFYGRASDRLYPATFDMKFSHLKNILYRIGDPSLMLQDSLMPLGSKTQDNQLKVSSIESSSTDLLHHIIAVSYTKIEELHDDKSILLEKNILCFLCITAVNEKDDTVTILSPQPKPLPPEHALLYSDVQFMDAQ